jgi:hypothetical protein
MLPMFIATLYHLVLGSAAALLALTLCFSKARIAVGEVLEHHNFNLAMISLLLIDLTCVLVELILGANLFLGTADTIGRKRVLQHRPEGAVCREGRGCSTLDQVAEESDHPQPSRPSLCACSVGILSIFALEIVGLIFVYALHCGIVYSS